MHSPRTWYGLLNVLLAIQVARAIYIDPQSLRCNGLLTPIGLSTATPRLSWIPESSARGDGQSAYQLQASSTAAFSHADLWDTGKVNTANTSVVYDGKALSSRERAYWRVRSWDAEGNAGPWSPASWFELAFMQQEDWTAKWITNEQYVMGENGLPVFAKSFNVACKPTLARLYYIGLGVQWAALNGEAVTDQVLLPSYSTMNTTLFYSSYDVTSRLHRGDNVLVVELGKGVYDAQKGLGGRHTKFIAEGAPLPLKLLAQLEYTCCNGKRVTVVSDESWETTTSGPYLEASWYGGENTMPDETCRPSISQLLDARTGPLANPEMPALKIIETFPCVSVTKTSVSYVFDLGQNFAGWYRFHFRGQPGQRITMWPSELLLSNGSADQSTTGSPIFDGYTFASNGVESYSPKFMYHGFRYVEVFGLQEAPSASDMVSHRIRIDAESTGSVDIGFSLFNEIHGIIDQAVQNQMYTVLTDCPHREKMGWLDQDNLAIDPVLFGYDFRAFGRHMMKQMRDAQNSIGNVSTTAPKLTEFGSWPPWGDGFDQSPNWGVSIVLFAWEHYVTYGDIEILEDSYEPMKGYIDYLSTLNATHILWSGLGDWEAIDPTTPFGVTGTSAFARGTQALARIATVLGQDSDAQKYGDLHAEILAAFNTTFFNQTATGITYGSGSQACDAIALDIGAVPSEHIDAVYSHLENSIRDNGTHVTVGETGLPALVRVLSQPGYQDLMYELMSSTSYPSYGFLVQQGATSMTEYWNGPLSTGSQDHIILDSGDVWLYSLAGMSQAAGSVGWQKINFEPIIVGDVAGASMQFQTVRGLAAASWQLEGSTLT